MPVNIMTQDQELKKEQEKLRKDIEFYKPRVYEFLRNNLGVAYSQQELEDELSIDGRIIAYCLKTDERINTTYYAKLAFVGIILQNKDGKRSIISPKEDEGRKS
ncbi:MAG: hypothetical protein WC788_07095 [Candidatus Paceibacterota bacterium]